jgi:prohibitin 1
MRKLFALLMLCSTLQACAVITQGEVGLRRRWGKIDPMPLEPGLVFYETVSTDILRVPVRTTTVTVDFVLPSKEGLNINARMAILYRILPERAADVITTIGADYEENFIAAVFRSAAADVSARFFAKDMYSAERSRIEKEVATLMSATLSARGIVIESVLMKSIALPAGLAAAIEQKLRAEQEAQQMLFSIEREKLEAQRKIIEATGVRDAQKIVSEGLTPDILKLRSIEAMRDLARSPNSKIVIGNGPTPLVLGQ